MHQLEQLHHCRNHSRGQSQPHRLRSRPHQRCEPIDHRRPQHRPAILIQSRRQPHPHKPPHQPHHQRDYRNREIRRTPVHLLPSGSFRRILSRRRTIPTTRAQAQCRYATGDASANSAMISSTESTRIAIAIGTQVQPSNHSGPSTLRRVVITTSPNGSQSGHPLCRKCIHRQG